MDFRADPYSVFDRDDAPVSLHARMRWQRGAGAAAQAARTRIAEIAARQRPDGSWDGSLARTIEALYALWLLGAKPDRTVIAGIDYLAERPGDLRPVADTCPYKGFFMEAPRRDLQTLRGVPFTMGCSCFVKTGAALFLAAQFGRQNDERIDMAYRSTDRTSRLREGRLCSGPCANNLHLAIAANPQARAAPGARAMVRYMEACQTERGNWERSLPFFQTLWVLSHMPQRSAAQQVERALQRVERTQNPDGSWGRADRTLCTYLVLDSLERAGAARL
jgi:hypothetical protein